MLLPVIDRCRAREQTVVVLAGAAFAASWDRLQRVIVKVEHRLGELSLRVGLIVTTLTGTNRAVGR